MNIPNTTKIILARHGETEWNTVRRLQGNLDSPMTERGKEQAKNIAETLRSKKIDQIVCSPLGRALESAMICKHELNIKLTTENGLVERNFGDWQGLHFDDLSEKNNFKEIFFQLTNHSPPNGESGYECSSRISSVLTELARRYKNQTVLVISHGDAIRCFLESISAQGNCDAYSQYGNGKCFGIEYCHNNSCFESYAIIE